MLILPCLQYFFFLNREFKVPLLLACRTLSYVEIEARYASKCNSSWFFTFLMLATLTSLERHCLADADNVFVMSHNKADFKQLVQKWLLMQYDLRWNLNKTKFLSTDLISQTLWLSMTVICPTEQLMYLKSMLSVNGELRYEIVSHISTICVSQLTAQQTALQIEYLPQSNSSWRPWPTTKYSKLCSAAIGTQLIL